MKKIKNIENYIVKCYKEINIKACVKAYIKSVKHSRTEVCPVTAVYLANNPKEKPSDDYNFTTKAGNFFHQKTGIKSDDFINAFDDRIFYHESRNLIAEIIAEKTKEKLIKNKLLKEEE